MLSWGASMLSYNAIAPDPEVAGPGWREAWLERIDAVEPYEYEWLRHQRRDDYWKQGSVCEDFGAIECPVYAIGGWADGYTEAVLRIVAGMGSERPRRACSARGRTRSPTRSSPGRRSASSRSACACGTTGSRARTPGVMDEPALRVWMQEPVAPAARHVERPGPLGGRARLARRPRSSERRMWLREGTLGDEPPRRAGSRSARTCSAASTAESGARTATTATPRWTSAPTTAARSASPRRRSTSASSCSGTRAWSSSSRATGPVAQLAARLCDVAPDGTSLLVTRGVLNLTHRDSHEHPRAARAGPAATRVVLELDGIAQAIPAGHRVRLALSPAYWPWLWPAPEPVTLAIHAGGAARSCCRCARRAPRTRSSDPSTSPRARAARGRRRSSRTRAPAR